MNIQNPNIYEHRSFWGTSEELLNRSWKLAKALGLNHTKINLRLVRYYATEGVIDKPDRLGREAAYNTKHLFQLILARQLAEKNTPLESIKLLTQKLSIEEIVKKIETPVEKIKDEIKKARFEEKQNTKIDESVNAEEHNYLKDVLEKKLELESIVRKIVNEEVKKIKYDLFNVEKFFSEKFEHLLSEMHERRHSMYMENKQFRQDMQIYLEAKIKRLKIKKEELSELEKNIEEKIKKGEG